MGNLYYICIWSFSFITLRTDWGYGFVTSICAFFQNPEAKLSSFLARRKAMLHSERGMFVLLEIQ
jgi:hypothetical protein